MVVIKINKIILANISLYAIGLMAYLPFITAYHRLPIPSFHAEWLAALFGLVAMVSFFRKEFWQSFHIPHISLLFAGLMALVLVQAMLGMLQSTQYTALVFSYLIWAFLLTVLGAYIRRLLGWDKIATVLSWGIVSGGLTNFVFALMQYLHKLGIGMVFMPNFSGFGAIGQLNHFANYISLAIASLAYLIIKKRLSMAIGLLVGMLFLTMLAFSGSRSTWLYLSAFVLISAIFRFYSVRQSSTTCALQIQQSREVLRFALILLPAFLIIQWLVGLLPGKLVALPNARLLGELGGSTMVGGIAMRLHIWYESLHLMLQSPWLGIGIGQTRWISFMTLDTNWSVKMPGSFEHSHNIVIQMLVETGIVGALLLVSGIASWLRGIQWRHINLETWWVFAILSVIGIHSMLEYPLWYAYFLGITAFLLGASDENRRQISFGSLAQIFGRASVVIIILIGSVQLSKTFIANSKLEAWVSHGVHGQITIENQPDFYRALGWVSEHSLLSPYVNVVYAIALNTNKTNLEDKIWLSESALRFIPTKTTAYRHALLLELNGQHKEAVEFLKRAVQAYPKDFKSELQKIPMQYWDLYLRLFAEAIKPESN